MAASTEMNTILRDAHKGALLRMTVEMASLRMTPTRHGCYRAS
jgi:hypothetical protein